ncbi:phage tail tape measure protein, partial [Delftia lacustris]|uniref:phage tail tape measure protein n=1 Tax=Delftia lacustris TaxID=558537 RepID=UPI00064088F9
SVMFGSDAVRAANVIYQEGEQGVRDWITAVDDQGYAAETAATRLDNLKGDWEALTGAIDSSLITMGEGANGPLRGFVQTLTDMATRFGELPDWAQQATLGVVALTGATALGAGTFLTAIPKIAEYRTALADMGTGAQRAGRFVEGAAKTAAAAGGFLALTIALSKTAEAFGNASDGARGYQETLKILLEDDVSGQFSEISSDVTDLDSALELLLGGSFNSNMERFGSTLNGIFAGGSLADQVSETREQFSQMGQGLAEMVNSGEADRAAELFEQVADAAEKQGFSVEYVNALMPQYQEALDGVANSS